MKLRPKRLPHAPPKYQYFDYKYKIIGIETGPRPQVENSQAKPDHFSKLPMIPVHFYKFLKIQFAHIHLPIVTAPAY